MARSGIVTGLFLAAAGGVGASLAETPNQLCDRTAKAAAAKAHIPSKTLLALSRLASGRDVDGVRGPWPWALRNNENIRYFEDSDALRAHLFAQVKTGQRRFQVGCFQLVYRLEDASGTALDAVLDPELSAHYAALFMRQIHATTGAWDVAIGAFANSNQSANFNGWRIAPNAAAPKVPLPGHNTTLSGVLRYPGSLVTPSGQASNSLVVR